ncbi:hypothetical protein PT974_10017 [Cladobotryum mycophilum]|uniref:ZZ-type domain-containing protein n=1 Tax=Cladobotryum mycophilum TaxID=491253 RepID=A0ABR0S974_9HYPO
MVSFLARVLLGSKGPIASSPIASSTSGSHVTDAPAIPRKQIGPATIHLKQELVRLYWASVKRELPHILLTLRRWQVKSEYAKTVLDDETDDHIHGYDTFLNQVSHSSRRVSRRPPQQQQNGEPPSYQEALQNRGWDCFAEMKSELIKEEIRLNLDERPIDDVLKRRARVLLQSLQLLDMDKMIEYREPEKLLSFWKRPAAPQLTSSLDKSNLPMFMPRQCSNCKRIIRGSAFKSIKDESALICENCYRKHHFGHTDFTKQYKSCCLSEGITPARCRRPTDTVVAAGKGKRPSPGGAGKVNCGLYELTDMVAEAKYAATRLKDEQDITLEEVRREEAGWQDPTARPSKLPNITTTSAAEFGSSFGYTTDSPEDIPIYIRSITDKYPYGNVHMALRLGPLIIENGHSRRCSHHKPRPPQLQVLRDSPPEIEDSLLLTGQTERTLYSQRRSRTPKRYKAMLKQVVGGAFSGFFDAETEDAIIDATINASLQLIDDGSSTGEKAAMMEQTTSRILAMLSDYLSPRLEAYIDSIVNRLLDPNLDLRWDFRSNNCQMFCDNLINRNRFGSFLARHVNTDPKNKTPAPLYLMSFVCRPGAYVKDKTKSKFDVPNGLTEEYLLKFRYGRHDESDIIDTLAEYWYDWGGFEGPIYRYQDVFPWDCTEAYGRYPVKCSECNISKHVLAFPFDSWSLISLHLSRGRQLYPKNPQGKHSALDNPPSSTKRFPTGHMTDINWFHNRLTVLLAQDTLLTAAVAMARCSTFGESTLWLHMQENEQLDRLKLGGIHRAQPFSHHFEKGAYHQYFVADWASMQRPDRIEAYETLRDWRATRQEIGSKKKENDSSNTGGGGGCANFTCGVVAASCLAGCTVIGGIRAGVGAFLHVLGALADVEGPADAVEEEVVVDAVEEEVLVVDAVEEVEVVVVVVVEEDAEEEEEAVGVVVVVVKPAL